MSHIFISYSRSDIDYVKKLEQRLVSEGFGVWYDRHLETGDIWWKVVKDKLRESAIILVLISETAANSKWVQREIAIADFLQKPVFPLLLEGDTQDDAWSIYSFVHYTDVRDSSLPAAPFYELLGRYAPRQKILGGVRTDGIYLCKREKAPIYEALRFYSNQSVTSFLVKPSTKINEGVDKGESSLNYRLADEEIRFEIQTGRALICKHKESSLYVRVEYPNGSRDFRTYEFIGFE